MKALLMYPDRNFDLEVASVPAEDDLVRDLGLAVIYGAMARGDKQVLVVVEKAVPQSLIDVEQVRYRQEILKDCLIADAAIHEMYALCVETVALERKHFLGASTLYPSSTLRRSVEVLEMLAGKLRQLRGIVEDHQERFRSDGLRRLSDMLRSELDDDYLAQIRFHLKRLAFRHGVPMSAGLDHGNKGLDYVLRTPADAGSWFNQLLNKGPETYTYQLPERDEAGARALSELQDRGINLVANALTQSTDHIMGFFRILRNELAFYIGCLNLYYEMSARGASLTFPDVHGAEDRSNAATGLIDAALFLTSPDAVVGNDLAANGRSVVVITGANQGGKSTFLRSIGLAQIMMQCGMFVAAKGFSGSLATLILTHFKREEDAAMESGKLDEELSRMSVLVDAMRPNALILFNESFSSTNEREGSDVARSIVDALHRHSVRIFFVTHQYELSHGLAEEHRPDTLFLRAERTETGSRTFKLREGPPMRTSYGDDLYRRIFGSEPLKTNTPVHL